MRSPATKTESFRRMIREIEERFCVTDIKKMDDRMLFGLLQIDFDTAKKSIKDKDRQMYRNNLITLIITAMLAIESLDD